MGINGNDKKNESSFSFQVGDGNSSNTVSIISNVDQSTRPQVVDQSGQPGGGTDDDMPVAPSNPNANTDAADEGDAEGKEDDRVTDGGATQEALWRSVTRKVDKVLAPRVTVVVQDVEEMKLKQQAYEQELANLRLTVQHMMREIEE